MEPQRSDSFAYSAGTPVAEQAPVPFPGQANDRSKFSDLLIGIRTSQIEAVRYENTHAGLDLMSTQRDDIAATQLDSPIKFNSVTVRSNKIHVLSLEVISIVVNNYIGNERVV